MLKERADYRAAQNAALNLIKKFAVNAPPVDPVQIARSLALNVFFVEFNADADNISGFYDPATVGIYVNKNEFPLRQTFTIAHELGHNVLHKEWANSSDYKILYRDQNLNVKDAIEQEANCFAANLLVPRFMLDRYWQFASVEELSKLFAVSVPVIRNRISFEYGA